ncbi:MAG: hypothetical protein LBR51_05460 [Bacteroidales bacterium]|jgi:hypothetical protein|nr:hypothetical protein [Bacteroidales bacterium]
MKSQCCAGGGGNPVIGDVSGSVLSMGEMEAGVNYQYINSNKVLDFNKIDTVYKSKYQSNYLYVRLAYGLTKELTLSLETGYWVNKTQYGLGFSDTTSSHGFGDMVLNLRYNILNKKNWDLTAGLGMKFPLGAYNDSIKKIEPFLGEEFYLIKPPSTQLSSGSYDLIFNILLSKSFPNVGIVLSSNTNYILKTYNPLGEKMGDYLCETLTFRKTFWKKLSLAAHFKYEYIAKMKINPTVAMWSMLLYDPLASGSHKLFITPQINYSPFKGFNIYCSADIPVYQYVNNKQIASKVLLMAGIIYRFQVYTPACCEVKE